MVLVSQHCGHFEHCAPSSTWCLSYNRALGAYCNTALLQYWEYTALLGAYCKTVNTLTRCFLGPTLVMRDDTAPDTLSTKAGPWGQLAPL